jgi:hypothetical protein
MTPPTQGVSSWLLCSRRAIPGTLHDIDQLSETAHFRPDDDGCYVAADLACPWCLSWQVRWRLLPGSYDARAECRCETCGRERTVFLTPEQALRLALHDRCPLDLTPNPGDLILAM